MNPHRDFQADHIPLAYLITFRSYESMGFAAAANATSGLTNNWEVR
ncbi:MAG: hypothetical protein M3410_03465 [Acidobacteriota bacterium]|nr:hypothetical protein [Acidobacteriota bacterium]